MNRRTISHVMAIVVFVLAAGAVSLAHDVTITYHVKLGNGPELQPGTYRVELMKNQEISEASFYDGDELVARVPMTIILESDKSPQTEVHYETLDTGRVINQIRVAGWKETLVFREPPQTPLTAD